MEIACYAADILKSYEIQPIAFLKSSTYRVALEVNQGYCAVILGHNDLSFFYNGALTLSKDTNHLVKLQHVPFHLEAAGSTDLPIRSHLRHLRHLEN